MNWNIFSLLTRSNSRREFLVGANNKLANYCFVHALNIDEKKLAAVERNRANFLARMTAFVARDKKLAGIGKSYPKSTYYVFPEAGDVAAAASAHCLLNTSWCCDVNDLGKGFRSNAASMLLSLVEAESVLTRSKPDQEFTAQTACEVFGCFCPAFFPLEGEVVEGGGGGFYYLQVGTSSDSKVDRTFPPYPKSLAGIPIGTISGEEGGQGKPVTSVGQFEEMLGESAERNLGSGLSGLFLPGR